MHFENKDYAPNPRQYVSESGGNKFCIVTLGAGSYVNGAELMFSGVNAHLMVGNCSSLSFGLNFLIGMNHEHRCVSTYPFRCRDNIRGMIGDINTNIWSGVPYPFPAPNKYQIIIGNDVWLGTGVFILGGVRIGNGAVLGANAVVTKDIPPYAVAVGNPARVVKYRFSTEMIHKLLAIKWWNWSTEKVWSNANLLEYPELFVEKFYSPELERFEEDAIGQRIREFKKTSGGTVYACVADFRASQPRWQRIIRGYFNSVAAGNRLMLVMWTGEGTVENDLRALQQYIDSINIRAEGSYLFVIESKPENIFSPYALRQADYFITTRELISLQCIDYIEGTNIKIVSSLDESIFPGEREYLPIWWW